MPVVNAPPRSLQNGSTVTQFTNTTNTTSTTYTYPTTQTNLIVENSGEHDIYLTVGTVNNQLIKVDTKYQYDGQFTQFSIRSDIDSQEFIATAFYQEYTDFNSLNDQLNNVTTRLAQSVQQIGDLTQLNTTDKTSLVNALKEVKTQTNNNLNSISSLGSGSPKGVYATLSALQTAFPTGTTGIYLVTADGNWYYWNGSAWTAGGVYQGTSYQEGIDARTDTQGNAFSTLKKHFDNIESMMLSGLNGVAINGWEQGGLSSGAPVVSGTRIRTTNYFSFTKNLIAVVGTGYKVAISRYNSSNVYHDTLGYYSAGTTTITIDPNYPIYKFVIGKSDDSAITPDLATNVQFYYTFLNTPSDGTVTKAKISSDIQYSLFNPQVRLDTLDNGADYINLFSKSDPDFVIDQGYSGTTASIVTAGGNSVTGYIKINNGETVYGTLDGNNMFGASDTVKLGVYDLNKNWISTTRIYTGYSTTPYVATADCYIRVQYVSTHALVVSTTARKKLAKDYVDYFSGDISTLQSDVNNLKNNAGLSGIDLFMFMGQSNMAGRGITSSTWTETAPTIISGAGYEFRAISDPTKLYPMAEPFGVNENDTLINDGGSKTGSMVTAFTNAYYKATKIPIVGVSASQGGQSITTFQNNNDHLTGAINRLNAAVTWLTNNGYTIRHKYMVWCQGETDGDNGMDGATYTSYFNTMLTAMLNTGIEKCFLVRIGNYNGAGGQTYTNIINAQTQIAQTNKNVVMVTTDLAGMKARGLMKDDFHYYQAGYNEFGTYAGANTAMFVNSGKEPTMYDTQDGTLYFNHKN
jgi:hypothetical protein